MTLNIILSALAGSIAGAGLFFLSAKTVRSFAAGRSLPGFECRRRIPAAAAAAVFGGAAAVLPGSCIDILYTFAMLFLLLAVSLADLEYRLIPNFLVLLIILLKGTYAAAYLLSVPGFGAVSLKSSAAGAAVLFVLFSLPAVFGRGIGCGDIKLGLALGFSLGLNGGLICMVIMGLAVLGYTALSQLNCQFGNMPAFLRSLKEKIPLGPALSVSAMCVLLGSYTRPELFV